MPIREPKYLKRAQERNYQILSQGLSQTRRGLLARLNLHKQLARHATSNLKKVKPEERVILEAQIRINNSQANLIARHLERIKK